MSGHPGGLGSERELKSFMEASLEMIRERLGDVSLESPIEVSWTRGTPPGA